MGKLMILSHECYAPSVFFFGAFLNLVCSISLFNRLYFKYLLYWLLAVALSPDFKAYNNFKGTFNEYKSPEKSPQNGLQ